MSNRLKRKLGDLGVDTSSRKANESFCLIGTPLPPLEKSKDNGEFVPLWKQDVRDEKGRRRLHGAFTGGFSAGYFNTVGSKEGWAPSTFVSSRGERAKQKAARPEDFMDDEDLQELKDSRNLVDTTEEMDFMGGTQSELQRREGVPDPEQDSIASALEASMLPPPSDSVGARILKKMGWRLGQGIGPRVTLRQRRLQDLQAKQASSVVRITGDELKMTEEDEEANKHTYAPRDTPLLIIERKDNSHGLGYRPGMGLNESLGVKNGRQAKGPNLSSGFGLGALNDADEDDLDVYDGGLNGSSSRLAYDILDHGEDDTVTVGTRSEKGRKSEVRSASSTATFHDGTPVLAGFVLSDQPVAEDRWFPLPNIPKGWIPDPRRVWDKDPNKENINKSAASSEPVSHGKWKTGITANDRGSLLGETPLPSAPRSVFDFISEKDRERLKNIATSAQAPLPSKPSSITIPHLEPNIAQAALRGFQPFTSDPPKQARYIAYLQSQLDPSFQPPQPNAGQKVDEFNKELEDYAKAAQIFKPITGAMAGRFTSAAVVDHGAKIHEGLHQPTAEEIEEKEEQKRKEEEENVSPKVHAARMGMYGPMTREVKPWQPAKLLCKRFRVKDPNPLPEMPTDAPVGGPSATVFTSETEQPGAAAATSSTSQDTTPIQTKDGPRDLSNIGLGDDESQGRDTLSYERPSMDVFKAIFASDTEDSDDEKDEVDEEPVIPTPSVPDIAKERAPAKATITTAVATPANEVVDISTFKPTFIPRDGKSKKLTAEKEKSKEKKEKKRKKGILVSFEMDEDGGGDEAPKPSKDRLKKKRKEKEDDGDAAMWVEKPAPEAVKSFVAPPPSESPSTQSTNGFMPDEPALGLLKGRKRAIDFM